MVAHWAAGPASGTVDKSLDFNVFETRTPDILARQRQGKRHGLIGVQLRWRMQKEATEPPARRKDAATDGELVEADGQE
jgi:hypothetical protein